MRGSMGKRTEKSGDRSRLKKRRSLTRGYQGDIWQNSSTDREIENTKGREKGDKTKIGQDGNIPQDGES